MDHKSEEKGILNLLKQDWGLQKPGLLISITGAAADFGELSTKDRERYFGAIVNAAVSTGNVS